MTSLTNCPNCGSKRFKKVRRDLREEYQGQPYLVRALEFQECAACGERLFSPDAMRRIEAVSPAYSKRSTNTGRRSTPRVRNNAGAGPRHAPVHH